MAPAAQISGRKISSDNSGSLESDVFMSDKLNGCVVTPEWKVRGSSLALETENPIRKVMDSLKPNRSSGKETISLGQGDPTIYGHLRAHEAMRAAVSAATQGGGADGYMHSYGIFEGRRAIAELYSGQFSRKVDPGSEVILTSGCNHAIELCIQAMCNPGDNILIPKPGYPLYEVYASFAGVSVKYYPLQPEQNWEIDLNQIQRLVDDKTVAIVVCNPGNPTGSVYSKQHLQEILRMANQLRLPIIADEVYSGITFEGFKFIPMGSLEPSVPILTVSSLSKNYLVPGWRLGWIVVSDWCDLFKKGRVLEAFEHILQFTAAPSSVMQSALKNILEATPLSHMAATARNLQKSADICCERVQRIPGLSCPGKPQGSMFVMVKIDPLAYVDIRDDKEWCDRLLSEEAVVVIPGTAFQCPNFVRCVFALPDPVLSEAWSRIEVFCSRHSAAAQE